MWNRGSLQNPQRTPEMGECVFLFSMIVKIAIRPGIFVRNKRIPSSDWPCPTSKSMVSKRCKRWISAPFSPCSSSRLGTSGTCRNYTIEQGALAYCLPGSLFYAFCITLTPLILTIALWIVLGAIIVPILQR